MDMVLLSSVSLPSPAILSTTVLRRANWQVPLAERTDVTHSVLVESNEQK